MTDPYTFMQLAKDIGLVAAAGVGWYLFLTGAIVTLAKIIGKNSDSG